MDYPDVNDPEVQKVIRDFGFGELQAIRHIQQRRLLARGLPKLAPQFSEDAIHKIAQRIAEIEDIEIQGRTKPADDPAFLAQWQDLIERNEARQRQAREVLERIDLEAADFDPSYTESDDADTWHAGQRKANRLQGLLMKFRQLIGRGNV